uniref:uncharacterized protein LOC122597065 n=1 Tax=Erigeron canadensis TaxID=72917 RepID=UPI001CB915C6|nr:uncharacterized protein LOC122597065 [Erigeron canadensis]XP_043625639.1 uncharacterized protein LOC122597065 [Erigeron canadensis]XP_043625645.1 uncharacterized protein LOC122597065 [Erigeron canadensis]
MPTPETNTSSSLLVSRCRRRPLKSKSADTFFRIMSFCAAHNLLTIPDNGESQIGSEAKDDIPLVCNDIISNNSQCQKQTPISETQLVLGTQEIGLFNKDVESAENDHNILGEITELPHKVGINPSNSVKIVPCDSLHQEEMPMDMTQMVLDTQERDLCNRHVESTECDHDILQKRKDLSYKIDANPSNSINIINQDHDMMILSPHLPTDKDFEEGEISGDLMDKMSFMDIIPEDDAQFVDKTGLRPEVLLATELGLENDDNLRILPTNTVEDVGKSMVGVVNKTARSLVDYSELVVDCKSREPVKKVTIEQVLPLHSNLKNSAIKNQNLAYPMKDTGAQNKKKRQGCCTKKERTNKKPKKSVYSTPCLETLTSLGGLPEDASQQVVDAFKNEDASNVKKKKQVTKEIKAKKKRNDRIRRAEKNRKLGVKRLKLQPVIKEKKVTYCRHYMNGRCHEGEKCKFSHDTTPLTKSKPCCHFARQACMKGDDCPFDHELSKYPCNNILSKGFCNRGPDCMFSHEAQPAEGSLSVSHESKLEPTPPSTSGAKKIDTKTCSVSKSVACNPEPKSAKISPKVYARPPKGISFLSQEKLPVDAHSSPKIDAGVKEIAQTPPSVQDPKEISRTRPAVPHGINFLSYGKKPSLDHSNGKFPFNISSGIGKSQLSNLEGGEGLKSDSAVNVVNGVDIDLQTNRLNFNLQKDRPSSFQKLMPMLPLMPSISQRALQSTLAFASKFESGLKLKH